MAAVCERRGDSDAARSLLLDGLAEDPRQARLHRALAKLEMRLGRVPEAMKVFREGYRLCQRDVHLLAEYAHALVRCTESEPALTSDLKGSSRKGAKQCAELCK